MPLKRYLLGIDIGSGACKVTVIDFHGNLVYTSRREYPTYYPFPGWAEQAPEDWYASVCEVITGMIKSGIQTEKIAAICLSAPTHTAVLLDKDHDVLRKAILWTDQRSSPQSERLAREFGKEIFQISCNRVDPVWTLPQLMWVKENEPGIWGKVSFIMFAKDYVRWRLTGTYATDWIDASGSMLFDVEKLVWSDKLCSILGMPVANLPPVLAPTELAGKISDRAARETGLIEGTPVIVGSTDTALEVFGAGAIEPGQCTIKLATAGRICIITDRAYPHPHLFNYRHVIPGRWYPGTGTKSCASSYRWFRDVFCHQETAVVGCIDVTPYEEIDSEAAKIPVGSEGLIFHPYLLGELSPYGDPYLRADFVGITMRHSKAHFARAVLEGVAFSLLDSISVLEATGVPIKDIRIIGGGARSQLWRQIVCDVLGRSALKPITDDSSFGGAMLAGIGMGVFEDAKEAVSLCVRISDHTTPDMGNHLKYRSLFGIYQEVHDSLSDIYKRLFETLMDDRACRL